MSVTSQAILDEVRRYLIDPDNGNPVVTDDTIRAVEDRVVPEVADALLLLPTETPLVTLVGGTSKYTLPGTVEYQFIDIVRFTADKVVLEKRPREWLAWKQQSDTSQGRPQFYTIEPKPDQTTTIEFWQTPLAAEGVEAILSVLPADWGTSTTAVSLPFSRRAAHACSLKVAAQVAAQFNQEKLIQLKMNPGIVQMWERKAFDLIRLERLELSRLKNTHGRTQRPVKSPARLPY